MEYCNQAIWTLYRAIKNAKSNHKSMVSCQKGPTRHAYACQKGPFWHDTLEKNRLKSFVASGYII